MTVTLFIMLFTIGAAASGLFTEAIKKVYQNAGREYSANVIALTNAILIGGLGTGAAYIILGVDWTLKNIICIALMIVLIWMGSMIGYEKIIQLFAQLGSIKKEDPE